MTEITDAVAATAAPPDGWKEVAPGVWSRRFGKDEGYSLLSAAGCRPNREALERTLPKAGFPIATDEVGGESRRGRTRLRFPLAEGEAIYGLGLDFNGVRRNRSVQQLHLDAWGGRTGRTHAPVPFYVSSRGYGVLVDSARYLTYYVGTGVRRDAKRPPTVYDRNTQRREWQSVPASDGIEVLVPAEGAEVLVFAGPTPMDAVRRFNLFCGGGPLPPKWGLGFTERTPTLYTAEQVKEETEEFEKRGFPLDFIGLEPGWHDFAYPCSFEWDRTRFPDPPGFVREMGERGVRLNLWFNPYVAPQSPLAKKITPHAGSHTVWNGLVADYSRPEARAVFADHLKRTVTDLGSGIGGFKIDEVDGHDQWLWPDTATFPSGRDAEEMRQTYGLLVQRTVHELFRAANRRTYGLARGTNAGGAYLPFVLYSDSYSFEGYQTALCNSGFSGLLWCPEVRSAKDGKEWLRRIQAVCFSPMAMLNAWASGTKPWTFPEVEDAVRAVLLLRLRLLPYLYTTFAQYHYEGTPPIRPMQLVAGGMGGSDARGEKGALDDADNPYEEEARLREVKDQYLLGDSLLVAPMPPDRDERTVVLPKGRWFDFYTGAPVAVGEGGTAVTVKTEFAERVPLFVRGGGIIPLLPEGTRRAPRPGETVSLEVRHYGDAPGEMLLYDDDGETFDHERGRFTWTRLRARKDGGDGVWRGEAVREKGDGPFSYGDITWRFVRPRPADVPRGDAPDTARRGEGDGDA